MAFSVPTAAAYAILYCVLVFFTVLAMGAAGWLPRSISSCCRYGDSSDGGGDMTDHFLSARNSAGSFAIAISFFASGMGAWVSIHIILGEQKQLMISFQILYASTEMGATPQLSWIAVIGYSLGACLPAIVIGWFLGPPIRNLTKGKAAFSTSDFGLKRYGRIMQLTIACISLFYMFIYITAELTSISSVFATLTNRFGQRWFGISITLSLGFFTVLYTTIGGLPASIVTDKFQGVIMICLVIMISVALTVKEENQVTKAEFALASNWTGEGVQAFVTLCIAIMAAEVFNQGVWQRVWAAKSVPEMRTGFVIGSFMVFVLVMFFGIMGMVAYANDPVAYDNGEKFSFLAFFDLLEPLGPFWHIVTLVLATALVSSSVDSLQNGMSSVFSHDLIRLGFNPKWVTRAVIILLNIPAAWVASEGYSVIELFLVADIVCATAAFPVFLGLQTKDYGMLKAPTEIGAFLGTLSGMATVLINGIINDAEGGVFAYFWLRNGGICALCGTKTMVSFIVTPIVSLIATYFFSHVDVCLRGERARRPFFPVVFEEDDNLEAVDDTVNVKPEQPNKLEVMAMDVTPVDLSELDVEKSQAEEEHV